MPTSTFPAHEDAYTRKSDPDANFGTESRIWVQRGSMLGDDPRYSFVAIDYDLSGEASFVRIVEAVLELDDAVMSSGFPLEAYTLDGAWTETGVTWNNQPTLDALLDEVVSDGSTFETLFEVTGAIGDLLAQAGSVDVGLRHAEEPQGAGVEDVAWWGREGNQAPVLVVTWEAEETTELASSVTVRRSGTRDLASTLVPRHHAGLASTVEIVYTTGLLATVTPRLHPLASRGRAQGIVTRLFLEPLEDVRRISDEAGSLVTRIQDGESVELRRIVQVLAAGTPAFSLSQTPTFPGAETGDPDTLRRGDAILFALGSDRWVPGERIIWDDRAYVVAGVLGVERVEGERLYQEIGLRRLSTTAKARATGVIA